MMWRKSRCGVWKPCGPVPVSQSDSELCWCTHQNIVKPWGLVDNMERMCAGPTFYDTPPGTLPEIPLTDSLLCVWTRLPLWNFHLIYSNWLMAGILCSIPTTLTHLSTEHPASTSSASLVYILVLSPDWSDICMRTTIPSQPRSQLTRQLIHIDQNLSSSAWPYSIQILHHSALLFSLHSEDWLDEFYHSLRFNNHPFRLPNSSSHSPPPVYPAPSPPTRELPLLLLGLCDNNNDCVAAQRAFCWASARQAGTENPPSLFYHLQPIPLCFGWRWSITGIKVAINVLSSRGHCHHSRTCSIFSLSTSLPLPLTSESNSIKGEKKTGQIIPCSSKCLLASSLF